MKKVISILLVITIFFMLACGCNKSDDKPTPDTEGNTKDINQGRLLKPYIDINKTGKYMITTEISLPDDVIVPITIIVSGSTKKMMTLNMPWEDGKQLPMTLMIDGERKVLMFSSFKTYGDIGKDQLTDLTEFLQGAYLQYGALSFVRDGTEDIEGTKYSYEDYVDPSNQQVARFLFKDGKLVMKGNVTEEGGANYLKFAISGNVSDDMFIIPKEFNNAPTEIRQLASEIDAGMKN